MPSAPSETDTGATDGGSGAAGAQGAADAAGEGPVLPWPAEAMPEVVVPADNPTTDEKVALGRLLFYDPVFSSDQEVACATCHSEAWGMGDALPVSIGLDAGSFAGPGRTGPNPLRRNAQTIWNTAYRETLFWDGRAASLEEQVRFPFEAELEFGRPIADGVADVAALPEYRKLFAAAFPGEPDPVTEANLEKAIAAFERSLISNNSLYDAYLAGDDKALTEETHRGMELFAEAGCASCHVPPLFSSEIFADRGVPALDGVPDEGRFEITQDEADRRAYKVPTLRNSRQTDPYFHTGGALTVDEAVHHEVAFSVDNDGIRPLEEDEIGAITAFIMKSLQDPTRNPIRPQEVPSGLQVPIDGFNLRR